MSEPIRYTFEAKEVLDANGMVCFVGVSTLTHPMGKYVAYEDYAKLRMERIHDINQIGGQCEEIARLKAEVENSKRINTELLVLCNRQASTIRSLTKAGDELHAFLINYIVESRISSAHLNKLDDGWLAAKEVQS
jgi:hypothetical protein